MFWSKMTAPEIRALTPKAVIILPTGSTEQHGPHMVTGTDSYLNELLQGGLEKAPPRDGCFIILPTLNLGTSEHHAPFGGTMTIPPTLYSQVIIAILRSLIVQGHKRIFVLNSHGGNQCAIATALAELAQECTRQGILLGGASYWTLCEAHWRSEIKDLRQKTVCHACEIEASLMMFGFPQLPLRGLPARVNYPAFLDEGWAFSGAYSSITRSGFVGEPRAASAGKGKRLLNSTLKTLDGVLARFSALPLPCDRRKAGAIKRFVSRVPR